MTDLERTYADLARQADGVVLPPPRDLRGRADRRTRVRLAAGVLAVAVIVGIGTAGVGWALRTGPSGSGHVPGSSAAPSVTWPADPSPDPSTAETTPTPVVTTPPPASEPPASATTIPTSAFLQNAELRSRGEGVEPPGKVLPPMCGARFATDSLIVARRAIAPDYRAPGAPLDGSPNGYVEQTVTRYRSDGAERFLAEVSAAVAACPTRDQDGHRHRYRLVSGPRFGDESIMIEIRFPALSMRDSAPLGYDRVQYVPVVRVGGAVTVLHDWAWEGNLRAARTTMEDFATRAAAHLRTMS